MQGHSEICDTQACSKVPPGAADVVDHILTQLLAKLFQLLTVEVFDMDWEVNGIQERREGFVTGGGTGIFQLIA